MPAPSPAFVASKANLGYGSAFYIGAGSPVNYTQVAEISSLNVPPFDVPAIDVTHLASPNATEEMIPGLIKPGVIEMTGNYIGDPTQESIVPTMESRTIFPWQIGAPMAGGKTFTASGFGFVTKREIGPFTPNAKVDFKLSVQATGTVTLVVA